MVSELHEAQAAVGATFENGVAMSFGNDELAIASAQTGVAVCDRTHWGRITLSGEDRIRFIHNQSTNDFQILKPGQGCDTVFVTSTARTLDLATAYLTEESVLLLVSPHRRQKILQWLDRYLFPADRVELTDITETTACFSIMGDRTDDLLTQLGATPLTHQPYATHQLQQLPDCTVRVAVGSGLSLPGYTLIVPLEQAATLWNNLMNTGAIPLGEKAWEQLRILQGRPIPDAELTEDYNPLEAGLWQTLSFEKGCYIGQETIARLNTYKGVKQQLWGIRLQALAEPGTLIKVGEDKVGTLTSITATAEGYFGLGYIRTKAGSAGLTVRVGETIGEIVEVPFLSRGYLAEEEAGK